MNIWELQEGKFYRIKNDIYSTVYKVKKWSLFILL